MSDTLETAPSAQIPPRYFWRRIFAYFIDVFLTLLAFTLILFLLSKLPLGIQPISFFNSTYCEVVASGPTVTKVEALWPLKQGEVRTNQMCRTSRLRPEQRLFVSSVSIKHGASTSTRFLTTVVDISGVEVVSDTEDSFELYNLISTILMAFLFAFLISKTGSTLGKKFLSLRVIDAGTGVPGFSRAVKRELLKLLPILVLGTIQVASIYLYKPSKMNLEEKVNLVQDAAFAPTFYNFSPMIVISLATLAWWFWPLIFWRGQTIYDRIAGCKVVREFYAAPRAIPRTTAI